MAGNENMSVEEVLAACRRMDGEGGGGDPAPAEAESTPEVTPAPADAPAEASTPPASGKKPGEMSVEEMLAAARAEKSGGSASKDADSSTEEAPAAAAPAASGKKPGEMSVAEMLAAARAEKAPKKDAPKKAAPAPKAKAAPAKAASAKKAAPKAKPSGPMDTASILAAARGTTKPGPITKAEAAERSKAEVKPTKPKLQVPPMPEKPAYAQAEPPAPASEDRRGFFATIAGVFVGSSLAIGFSALAFTNVLWVLGLARFMFPNILTEPPTQFKVGFPDDFAPGQVETKYKAQFGVWIVRYEYDGVPQIYALQSVCTHLGCTPNWLDGEQKFKCPCHGSGFYKDGINFEGPAPRPLERFAVRVADDGQLEVDKSRTFKEEIGQWSDPASYVPV